MLSRAHALTPRCRYQSTTLGTFQTMDLIETFVNYHENIRKCVCIVYDPQRSARGSLALKAIRLKDQFISMFKEQKLTAKDLREANIAWKDVFQEIPIKVQIDHPIVIQQGSSVATVLCVFRSSPRINYPSRSFVHYLTTSSSDCARRSRTRPWCRR